MKPIFFKFRRFALEFVCFGTAAFDTDAFDTDTSQRAILYQKEGHLILYPVIKFDYFLWRLKRFSE